ncbi:MAG: translation elongation factor Ts [Planctomycetota bacterium]|nr:MAG: translation elongation factor Ts [Planctomycetota bacterium]
MSEITAQLVRDLREKSGAGMMDCKKALTATGGDFEAAFDHLRKSGLKAADKRLGRATGEGRVSAVIADDGRSGSMVALSCETDFVARTTDFEAFLGDLGAHVLEHRPGDVPAALGQPWKGEGTVEDALKLTISKLGENILVSAVERFENPAGYVVAYVHHDLKKGAIVSVTTDAGVAAAEAVLRDLCMHIVVYSPEGLSRDEISAREIEREKDIYREEVKAKPEEIQDKIIAGKLEKFFAARIVTEQPWVKDDKLTVQKALENALGTGARIAGFARVEVGA